MIVSCTSCGAKYRYDETRFEGKASKKIRCTKCETVFEIENPAKGSEGSREPTVNLAPVGNEMTFSRRDAPDYRHHPGETTRQHVLTRPRTAPHPQALRLPTGKKLSLAVISGPDSGKTFPIDRPRTVIGRAGADVVLSDAEISRAHAAIEVDDDTVTVFDLESTNGTYVDGERVDSSSLDNFGEFEIGGTTLMLIVTAMA